MRRAIIALVTATALMLTGLTPGPLRVSALGETSVTLNCSDGTSLTLLVDADELASLTAAVQGMIDYPAGLSCTLVQNPLPLTTSFGHVALAANPNTMVVAGGRWQVGCSSIFSYRVTSVPGSVVARGAKRPALASLISAAPADCADPHGCVWVNIAVNLHTRDNQNILEGTLNETIPENQSCPNPVLGDPDIAIGPSHFVSKPMPQDCLAVVGNTATTRTYVTQTSGLPFPPGGKQAPGFTGLQMNDAVNFSFIDNGNPSQWTDTTRDMLEGPPVSNTPSCPNAAVTPPGYVLQNGNINIFPR
jgi:hypothetical protein